MDYVSLACCLLAFVLYYNTLDAGFVYDDRRAILSNPDVVSTTPWRLLLEHDFWGTPLGDSGSHGSYRPLCVLTFRLNHLLGGLQPFGYHLVNVLLHCLATVLLVRVSRRLLAANTRVVGSAVAGLLFAAHPVHTEAVAGVVGRADLAACNLYLLALLAYMAHVRCRDRTVCCCCCCSKPPSPRYQQQRCAYVRRTAVTGVMMMGGGDVGKKTVGYGCCARNGAKTWIYMGLCLVLAVAAMLSKETGITVLGVCCVYDLAYSYASSKAVAGVVGRTDLAACDLYLLALLAYMGHVRCRDRTACCCCCCCCSKPPSPRYQQQRCGYVRRTAVTGVMMMGGGDVGKKTVGYGCCARNGAKTWIYMGLCLVLAVAAMLSKETGITVLGVCCVYDLAYSYASSKKRWRSLVALCLSGCLLLLLRLQTRTPDFSTADNPTARETRFLTRLLTFAYLPALNFRLLTLPDTLSFDWGMDAVPRITTLSDPRNLCTLLFYASFCAVLKNSLWRLGHLQVKAKTRDCEPEDRRHHHWCRTCLLALAEYGRHSALCRTANNNNNCVHPTGVCPCRRRPVQVAATRDKRGGRTVVLALTLLALPFLPATNALFYVGFVVAERVLYLPSAGACLLVGLGGATLWQDRRYRTVSAACFLLVLVAFGAKTVTRNGDWRSEETLYRSAVTVNPPKAYGNLGSVLSSQGRTEEAEWAFRKALQYRPNMADVHYNLGILLQGKNNLDEAILSYQRAIHFRPSLALAYVNLGAALIAAGRCQEAVSVLRQGSRLDGTGLKDRREHETAKVSALLQLGALYSDQGRLQRALAAYREAAHSLPDHYPPQSVFNVLGETLARLQQDEEAERWYQAALNAQPDHVPAHITYGKLLAKNVSRAAEAEQWFRKAQRLAPEEPSVYHYYGEFLASRRRHKEAAGMYERAAELRPRDYDLAVAAATAMRQAGRHRDAEIWYRRAVALKPTDARSHTNLGAILHLNGKYNEAADSYKEALRLQPNDITTLTNLHRLHTIMT